MKQVNFYKIKNIFMFFKIDGVPIVFKQYTYYKLKWYIKTLDKRYSISIIESEHYIN